MRATAKKNPGTEEKAYEAVAPLIKEKGFTLWDVCYEKEGAMWYLRILIDKPGGIDSDECEEISRPINEIIDKQDFISSVDILEVGSPGLTKKLRKPEHFRACTGERIRVTLRGDKGKEYSEYGILSAYSEENDTITLDSEGQLKEINIPDCVKINSDL